MQAQRRSAPRRFVVARGAKLLEHPEAAQAGALWTPRRGLEGRVGGWPAFPGVQRTFSGAPTSHVRASSATAPRLPDADRHGWRPDVGSPGSRTRSVRTCQGLRPRRAAQALASIAPVRVAFRLDDGVGARDKVSFAAQWLAYALPCRRFARALADTHARLGASVGRYSFTAEDLHLLLLAGLPAHRPKTCTQAVNSLLSERTFLRRTWTRSRAAR